MVEITIKEKDIRMAKRIITNIDTPKGHELPAEIVYKSIRPILLKLIEHSFRSYAKKHTGCTTEMEELEWRRFKNILVRNL